VACMCADATRRCWPEAMVQGSARPASATPGLSPHNCACGTLPPLFAEGRTESVGVAMAIVSPPLCPSAPPPRAALHRPRQRACQRQRQLQVGRELSHDAGGGRDADSFSATSAENTAQEREAGKGQRVKPIDLYAAPRIEPRSGMRQFARRLRTQSTDLT